MFFPPPAPGQSKRTPDDCGQTDAQKQDATKYYRQVKTGPKGFGESISAALPTLQAFRKRYFSPFECNDPSNEPEAVTTYFNGGDLGIGREMHCIYNGCPNKGELACYVLNFGKRDGTPLFGNKAEAQVAVEDGKPFAIVGMVERGLMPDEPTGGGTGGGTPGANRVFFAVYAHDPRTAGGRDLDTTPLATSAQLDRKCYNTSIPGNCLQCHGINSSYTSSASDPAIIAREVRRAYFLPFDLDSFAFFSDDPSSKLSRSSQEAAFRAQNRMVRNLSRLEHSAAARELIDAWYGEDLLAGTFNGRAIPEGWFNGPAEVSREAQGQLYQKVNAPACRTCHISYEQVDRASGSIGSFRSDLQFGTYAEFAGPAISQACPPTYNEAYRENKPMPNAEQTLKIFCLGAGTPLRGSTQTTRKGLRASGALELLMPSDPDRHG